MSRAVKALIYLQAAWLSGLLRSRVMRLRQPKYLLGACIGTVYLYFLFLHPASRTPQTLAITSWAHAWTSRGETVAWGFLALLLVSWVRPRGGGPGLKFSKAEISFLFPAPLNRHTLVSYRLVTQLLELFVAAGLLTVLSKHFNAGAATTISHTVGGWVILGTLRLHAIAASFVIAHLAARGIPAWLTRLFVLVALLTLLRTTLYGCGEMGLIWLAAIDANPTHARQLELTAPAAWLLAVAEVVLGPFRAANWSELARSLPPALGVLGLHYLWVLWVAVNFEEFCLALGDRRAARAQGSGTARRGLYALVTAPRAPFDLKGHGAPELALLWKNLLAAPPTLRPRAVIFASVVIAAVCLWLAYHMVYSAFLPGVSGLAAGIAMLAPIVGPQLAPYDLRAGLHHADLLKTYPLRGWQIVLGELAAPILIVTSITWLALVVLVLSVFLQGAPALGGLSIPRALSMTGAFAMYTPVLCAFEFVLPNAVALVLPAWSQLGHTEQGLDVMGHRLLWIVLQQLVTLLLLLPAGVAAWGASSAAVLWTGVAGASSQGVIIGAVALIVGAAELAVVIRWLGDRFERIDLWAESRP